MYVHHEQLHLTDGNTQLDAFTSLQTDNHTITLSLSFLQVRRSSCSPTNSIKAVKLKPTSLTCNTESAVSCMEFVSSSLSVRTGCPMGMYVVVVLPRNAFTVSDWPRTLRRNAVRHLESMFNLIRCQSRSVMPNRWTR